MSDKITTGLVYFLFFILSIFLIGFFQLQQLDNYYKFQCLNSGGYTIDGVCQYPKQ